MVDVPIYLKECTKIKKVQKDAIILQVLCDCGCSLLHLAAFGFKHIPIGTVIAGIIGSF